MNYKAVHDRANWPALTLTHHNQAFRETLDAYYREHPSCVLMFHEMPTRVQRSILRDAQNRKIELEKSAASS